MVPSILGSDLKLTQSEHIFAKHFQENSLSFSTDFINLNVTPYGLANRKLCDIQMLLMTESKH